MWDLQGLVATQPSLRAGLCESRVSCTDTVNVHRA